MPEVHGSGHHGETAQRGVGVMGGVQQCEISAEAVAQEIDLVEA